MNITSTAPQSQKHIRINTDFEFCNHAFMCIKESSCSDYLIPENLTKVVQPILQGALELSTHLASLHTDFNCYLSIRHEYVNPSSIGNRPDWHIDGFKSDQYNFIWFDSLPTEVCLGDFSLTNDHDISLLEMKDQAIGMPILNLKPFTLYEMDLNCVHRPTFNKTNNPILRAFIKLTFSKEVFNCVGNSWNYLIPHVRPTVKRKNSRNHGVL